MYLPKLLVPDPIPKDFLRDCAHYAASAVKNIDSKELERMARFLSAPSPAPARIEKVSPEVGRGVFADRDLLVGEIIGEYAGVLTKDWKSMREGGEFNPYLLKYPFPCAYAIDAEYQGNETRFINHSSKNANAGRRYVLHEGIVHVVFVVEKNIAKDSQILIDYGGDFWGSSSPVEL